MTLPGLVFENDLVVESYPESSPLPRYSGGEGRQIACGVAKGAGMNRFFLSLVGCALFASSATAQNSAASKIAPEKGWLSDWSSAKAQAQQTGKPLMVIFRCDP